jgi:hypothetical protein
LRKRSHRLGFAFANQLHPRHKCRTHSAKARKQNSQLSLGRRNFGRLFHATPLNERSKNDRRKKSEFGTSAAAAEVRSGPKQTSNDEGSAQDLQIEGKRTRIRIA